jgi:hypothetical protein
MSTFAFYADAALTTPLTTLTTQHLTDASTDPIDAQVWIGSTAASKQLRAASNPGVDQITLTITQKIAAWSASAAVSAGALRRPTTTNNRVYQAGGSGTTGATEPTWPTTIGATVADNGITWTCLAYEDTPNEVKLATTQAGLAAATPGAGLNLGTTLLSGVGNATPVWVRVTNPDANIQDQTHLRPETNDVREDAV